MLFKQVEADEKKGKQNLQCIDDNLEIVLTNEKRTAPSATKLIRIEARKKNDLK